MPTFEIPDGPTTIDVPRSGDPKNPQPAEGSATYTVNNRTSQNVSGSLSVKIDGASKREWFTIEGESERDFTPGTNTVTVKAKFPPETEEAGYPFRLIVSAVSDPDNDFAEGPATLAKLGPGRVIPPPRRIWLWILAGVVALIVIGGGVYKLFLEPKPVATEPKEGPPTALDTSQALQLAEKKTIDWLDAYNAHDVGALVKLSEPPFVISSPLLLSKAQVRGQYEDMFSPAAQPAATKLLFTNIEPQTIVDFFKSINPDAAAPTPKTLGAFWTRLNVNVDGVCVVGKSHGDTYLFMFRRTPNDVQLAAVMGTFPQVPTGSSPPPPPPPPAPE